MVINKTGSHSTDEFGSLPLNFTPGPLKRLLGCSVFTVEADCLVLQYRGSQIKVRFTELSEITGDGRRILLQRKDGEIITLWLAKDSVALVALLKKLHHEAFLWQTFLAGLPVLDQCFAFFCDCLQWRGLPYVMAADALLATATCYQFSDIHLEPLQGQHYRISYRIAAEVRQAAEIDKQQAKRLLSRLKYLAGCLSHVDDSAQEGAFNHGDIAVRLSTFPADGGERASLRLITALKYPTIKSLGWDAPTAEEWLQQINSQKGLFIISGPVGSGKTTAMYATLADLANQNQNLRVVTIEDPVEAQIDGICQSSLDNMKEGSLAQAFKHLLRQDPDVLALGEIRDSVCIREALQASLSGHLIFATFHAGSAGDAVDRIKQMGVEDYLIMSGLKGILHLNLIRQDDRLKPVVNFKSLDHVKFEGKK